MNKILITLVAFSLVILMVILPSCRTENPQPDTPPTGKLSFNFKHNADGSGIVFDSLIYVNEAGNNYLINEIQYFISDVTLHKNDGTSISLNKGEDIHYVDTDLPETQTYTFSDSIPIGSYDKITFTFGINEEKNVSLMFVNPPESFMFWPEKLGGGYHYMKFNGKWLNEQGQLSPFNCHLGIGQIYYSFPDSISSFVQNYFEVSMQQNPFEIVNGDTTQIDVTMNVENWFRSPNTYDHNYWGGDIMQKQDAMHQIVENGHDVFTYNVK